MGVTEENESVTEKTSPVTEENESVTEKTSRVTEENESRDRGKLVQWPRKTSQ